MNISELMITFNVVRYPAEIHNGYWWKYNGYENIGTINVAANSYPEIIKTLKLSDVFRTWRKGRFVYIVTNNYYYKLEEI